METNKTFTANGVSYTIDANDNIIILNPRSVERFQALRLSREPGQYNLIENHYADPEWSKRDRRMERDRLNYDLEKLREQCVIRFNTTISGLRSLDHKLYGTVECLLNFATAKLDADEAINLECDPQEVYFEEFNRFKRQCEHSEELYHTLARQGMSPEERRARLLRNAEISATSSIIWYWSRETARRIVRTTDYLAVDSVPSTSRYPTLDPFRRKAIANPYADR